MGGTSSVLTVEQQSALSKKLKDAYETCKADNLEDEIIQSTLESEYKKLLEQYKSLQTTEPVGNAPKIHKSGSDLSKRVTGRIPNSLSTASKDKEPSVKQKPTRRRSFDQAVKKVGKESDIVNALKVMSETSKSAAEIPVVTDVVDSWDSVSQQPFCTVCQMAFKSLAFLDRHVKYSDLHTKNVIKSQVGATGELNGTIAEDETAEPQTVSPTKDTLAAKFTSKQVEGTHYKLMYTGSKFFWRSQRTVVLDLYLHLLSQTVEIIAFDSDKHKEMNRLYLDAAVLNDIIEVAIAEDLAAKVKEILSADRFAELDEQKLKGEMMTTKTVSYILARIQLGFGSSTKISSSAAPTIIEFTKMSGDDYATRSPVLEEAPIVLVPIGVTRRRRTNAEDFEKTITGLQSDRLALSSEIEKARSLSKDSASMIRQTNAAERIANHVYDTTHWFLRKKWYNGQSKWRKKWIKACRMVVRKILVAKTKAYLTSKGIPFEPVTAPGGSPSNKPKRNTIRTLRAKEI